jgi:outer membrane receptor protein involved in Fe transport
MKLSDVESFDARVEYVWGELGDLGAVSGFYKTVQDPIESIIVRNPADFSGGGSALYRTFFNNPNQAKLWGIEIEGRKNLGFIPLDIAQYFSIGGNYTYIWAKVDRTETELARTQPFFGTEGEPASLETIDKSRRLFGQPEWIANLDLSFDHPDWGTKVTLSFFAISDLLDAAGSATIAPDGRVTSITLDRYVDSFSQLNLIMSQSWPLEFIDGDVTLKGNIKNLTDSERRIVYDQDSTSGRTAEREYKIGLDYSVSITYSLSF